MSPLEIIVIILVVLFLGFILGRYIFKKIKGEPTGECACCKDNMKSTLKKINKEIRKDKKTEELSPTSKSE